MKKIASFDLEESADARWCNCICNPNDNKEGMTTMTTVKTGG